MSHLSHVIRRFNRFELKYLINLKEAAYLKSELGKYLVPDDHGDSCGSYPVASLYFDSPGKRCYWEKENGLKFRRKLRIRYYPNGEPFNDQTAVFVEIKQRVDRAAQKRRLPLPYQEALRLCYDRQIPDHNPQDRAVVDEIYVFLWQYNLLPASIVRYDRQALIGTRYDIGLRVTFDTAVSFELPPLRLHEGKTTLPLLGANQVVMEIKVNDRIPSWLTDLIAAHNLHLQRISKYCTSLEAASRFAGTSLTPLTTEPAREVLSSTYSLFNPIVKEFLPRN